MKYYKFIGGFLDKSIKITKDNYISDQKFPYYCPNETPYMCGNNTIDFGMCKEILEDCDNIDGLRNIPILDESIKMDERGSLYGYDDKYLADRCDVSKLDFQLDDFGGDLPNKLKIITYNIWGLLKNYDKIGHRELLIDTMKIRMKAISKIILDSDPDIICFQEMTDLPLAFLERQLGSIYKYRYEPYFDTAHIKKARGRGVENCIFSKYRAKSYKVYSLSGNLGYNNVVSVIEFNNVVIFNCYLQAGSKYSPGQEYIWFHYSRCRIQELQSIKRLVEMYRDKKKILVGDFNFHIGGDMEEWPENRIIQSMKMIDLWKMLKGDEDGFTENTVINKMRWNTKFLEKQFRYDGIFCTHDMKPIDIELVGTEEIRIDRKLTDRIIKYWVPKDLPALNIRYTDGLLTLHPSDHFGLRATIDIS